MCWSSKVTGHQSGPSKRTRTAAVFTNDLIGLFEFLNVTNTLLCCRISFTALVFSSEDVPLMKSCISCSSRLMSKSHYAQRRNSLRLRGVHDVAGVDNTADNTAPTFTENRKDV